MIDKLPTNTEYGQYLENQDMTFLAEYGERRKKFDKVLLTEPKKWMFVPCDENDNILEKPIEYARHKNMFAAGKIRNQLPHLTEEELDSGTGLKCLDYEIAEKRILFQGFYTVETKINGDENGILIKHKQYSMPGGGIFVGVANGSTIIDKNHTNIESFSGFKITENFAQQIINGIYQF